MNALTANLLELERRLQLGSVRKSPTEVDALLTRDFLEFGSSGRVFDRVQTVAALSDALPAAITMSDFAARLLAEGVALVTYRASSSRAAGADDSLRSSIWLQSDAGWQMCFHQGTRSGSHRATDD